MCINKKGVLAKLIYCKQPCTLLRHLFAHSLPMNTTQHNIHAHHTQTHTTHSQTSGSGAAKVKQYHHYAYKTEAVPPFRICAVSEELPLVTRKRDDNAQRCVGVVCLC